MPLQRRFQRTKTGKYFVEISIYRSFYSKICNFKSSLAPQARNTRYCVAQRHSAPPFTACFLLCPGRMRVFLHPIPVRWPEKAAKSLPFSPFFHFPCPYKHAIMKMQLHSLCTRFGEYVLAHAFWGNRRLLGRRLQRCRFTQTEEATCNEKENIGKRYH